VYPMYEGAPDPNGVNFKKYFKGNCTVDCLCCTGHVAPAVWFIICTGATGDFATLNGTWPVLNTGFCEWRSLTHPPIDWVLQTTRFCGVYTVTNHTGSHFCSYHSPTGWSCQNPTPVWHSDNHNGTGVPPTLTIVKA
jgi:hypothetical protein